MHVNFLCTLRGAGKQRCNVGGTTAERHHGENSPQPGRPGYGAASGSKCADAPTPRRPLASCLCRATLFIRNHFPPLTLSVTALRAQVHDAVMNSPHNSLATILDIQGGQVAPPPAGEEGDGAILMSCE